MPHTKSAAKRLVQSEEDRLRNKAVRSAMKTAVKRVMDAIEKGDAAEARKLLPLVMKRIDKAAKVRVIHPNAASRKKSQVVRSLAPKADAKAAGAKPAGAKTDAKR